MNFPSTDVRCGGRALTRRRSGAVAALAAASLVLAACGGDEPSGGGTDSGGESSGIYAELDTMYKAAQDAGQTTVTIYGAGAPNWEPLVQGFNERYPDIQVELVNLVGPDLLTRLSGELSSGQITGDVVFGPIKQGVFSEPYDDYWVPLEVPGVEELPEYAVDPDGLYVAPFVVTFGVVYNSEELSGDEAPEGWDTLIEPDWAGRTAIDLPKIPSATSIGLAYAQIAGVIDDAWLEDFVANEPVVLTPSARIAQAMVAGEVDASIYPLGVLAANQRQGAPLTLVPGSAVGAPSAISVLDGAPNPEAAQLFIGWSISPEAQELYAAQGQLPVLEGAPLPEGYETGDVADIATPFAEVPEEEFNKVYAEIRENPIWDALG